MLSQAYGGFIGDNDKVNVNALIDRAQPGDRIYIEEIKARGPDGRTRNLNSITLLLLQ